MPWYRCILENKDKTVELTIDVLTDENNIVDRNLTFFGYWRDRSVGESQAFALNYDGTIDWGSSYVSTLPIRGSHVAVGERHRYTGYLNGAAFVHGEVQWEDDFRISSYRDHAA